MTWFQVVAMVVTTVLSVTGAGLMLRTAFTARTSVGLATGTLLLYGFIQPYWLGYAVAFRNWNQIIGAGAWVVVLTVWWGFWLRDRGRRFFWAPVGVAGWTAATVTVAVADNPISPDVFGWVAGFTAAGMLIPQLVTMYRADHVVGAGFSIPGWSLVIVSLAAWVVYGVITVQWPIIVTDILSLAICVAIVARARWLTARVTARSPAPCEA